MSIKEQSLNYKKVNESSNKKEEVPIKTSQSMNTESYEYFSQKITTKNNITESSVQTSNQNAHNQLLQCTCDQNLPLHQNQMECTCNQAINYEQCTCGKGLGTGLQCTCGKTNKKCTCGQLGQKFTFGQSEQNYAGDQSEQKCTCGQSKCSCGLSNDISLQKKIEINNTTSTSNYNNASRTQKISVQSIQNKTSINTSKINEEKKETSINAKSKICNCANRNDKITSIQNIKKSKVIKKKINLNKNNWNKRCVGQNNENLQIIAAERPELLMQCVQDIKVIQEPRPVQIILPIVPNEIDYPLGLEIYGKEKKVFICPENVENLKVSKAYSKIEPHFENLDIAQNENVHCEKTVQIKEEPQIDNTIKTENTKIKKEPKKPKTTNNINIKKAKKERYEDNLTMENGEMFVKGEKDFNKDNEVELTTKMNVKGKQKFSWNETNEAIKTTKMNIDKEETIPTFDNLYIENNAYNYQGQTKKKFSSDETNLESNEEMQYPAEYVPTNWNLSTIPMSGKPFTLEGEQKTVPLYTTAKGEKVTIKKSYETPDWNKKNNKRKEVQINMIKHARKNPLKQQKVQPIVIKGNEKNWNDVISQQNDTNLIIDKTEKVKDDFVLSHGEEVSISKEGEDILINDDYNIVEENYTRPIRANIQKVPDVSEESISSEYDVLKGISKYMGQYQYKELVGESLKVKAQNIIINDISGKYPRRVESYHGLDENFEKQFHDQHGQQKINNDNYNININIQKKIVHHSQHDDIRKEPYDYSDQNEPEPEQEGSNENENEYVPESEERDNNEPEDAQEPGQEPDIEPEEQENMDVPEDKDHVPEDEGEHEEMENENVEKNAQYYYLKKNEEKNDSEPKDEMEKEQESNQNEEEEVKDTPVKNEESPEENSPKVYIKEITYTKNEQTLEKKGPNLRYITLKKKEEDEEEEEDKEIKPKIDEQEKKSDFEQKYEKKESIFNQYLTMPSKKVDEEHISRDGGDNEDNELDEELKKKEDNISEEKKEEIKGEIKEENTDIKKEENIEQKEVQHIEEKVEEKNIEQQKEENNIEQHEAENELNKDQQKIEQHEEEHVEQHEEEHIEPQDEEVEHNEEEQIEQHEEEEVEHNGEENIEHHEEGQLEEENNEEQIEQHDEEHIDENHEEHVEEKNVENVEKQEVKQKVEEKTEQKEQKEEEKPQGQFEEEQTNEKNEENAEEHIEEQVKEKLEEHPEEHSQGHEELHKEELIIESKKIIQDEKKNIEQNIEKEKEIQKEEKEEIHKEEHEKEIEKEKENIQEKKGINIENAQKEKKISNIIVEAIKSELESQELKSSQEMKINSENIILKKSKLDPVDNYTKITSTKISVHPSGERVVTKTEIHQKTETISSKDNPMMYSFGKGSVENIKNVQSINAGFQGSNITFGQSSNLVSGSGLRLENNLNPNQIQYESNYTSKSNMIGSNLGMSGRYYFSKNYSSHTYSGRSMREPMDTIKGRKKMENDMKAGYEIEELNFGPRDSKRK